MLAMPVPELMACPTCAPGLWSWATISRRTPFGQRFVCLTLNRSFVSPSTIAGMNARFRIKEDTMRSQFRNSEGSKELRMRFALTSTERCSRNSSARRARRRPDDDCAYPSPRKAGELDPEWVMCGVDVPAGKRLYASKDLKGSAFQLAIDQHGNGDGWHLTTTMCHMLVITKPTYAECLAELMRIWQNWDAEGRALPAGSGGGGREYPGVVAR